jgi:hypothetical protein
VQSGNVLTWPPGSAAPQTFQLRGARVATTSVCVLTPAGDLGVWPPTPFTFPVSTLCQSEAEAAETERTSLVFTDAHFSLPFIFLSVWFSCSLPNAKMSGLFLLLALLANGSRTCAGRDNSKASVYCRGQHVARPTHACAKYEVEAEMLSNLRRSTCSNAIEQIWKMFNHSSRTSLMHNN